MREKMAGFIVLAAAAVLFLIVVLLVRRDSEGPQIMIPSGMSYTDGQDLSILLDGVTAMDAKDGDVSDTLVVESLIVLDGGDRAKVTYIAKDKSNNVTAANNIVSYSGDGSSIYSTFSNADSNQQMTASESTGEDMTTDAWNDKNVKHESNTEEMTSEENHVQTEDTTAKENLTKKDDDKENITEEATAYETASQEDTTEEPITEEVDENPVIKLSANETTINRGELFKVFNFVEDITDDKDERDYLFQRISVSGQYDIYTPGDYELYIFCIDSDNNRSNQEKFILHVVE